ncbi:MAG TPA: hypothetical protein VFT99_23105, partial [Roseiflexaceae bacterium]|nr:hypothetical protein [Roseiflexaceae bacterium]
DPLDPPVIEVWGDGNGCERDGEYNACLFFGAVSITKPVRLIVRPGTGAVLLTSSGENRRVITVDGRATSLTPENTEISGFIIKDGDATSDTTIPDYIHFGGGILVLEASPLIQNNLVTGNRASQGQPATAFGGGMALVNSSAVVRSNRITGNIAGDSTVLRGHGGGVAAFGGSPTLERNEISFNYATTLAEGIGGGVYLNTGSDAGYVLDGNLIFGNFASTGDARPSQAGGVYVYNSRAMFANNIIAQNNDQEDSDGILFDSGSGTLIHTTITANGGPTGIGAYVRNGLPGAADPAVTFINTIVSSHAVGVLADFGSTVHLKTTLFSNQTQANTQTLFDGTLDNANALEADPRFLEPKAPTYHIALDSPAVNAGEATSVSRDIDNQLRIGQPDIGADEAVVSTFLPLVVRP